MEDELWLLQQQSRRLQAFRQEISPLWDDHAAKDLNHRFLDPHQSDDSRMVKGVVDQSDRIKQADVYIEKSVGLASEVAELSTSIQDEIGFCQEDIDMGYQLLEKYSEFRSRSIARLPNIEKLIQNACTACQGVATE